MGQQVLCRARIGENTSSIGTGDAILNGAILGYRPFSSVPGIAHGDFVTYLLKASNGQWEIGEGLYMTMFGPGVPRIWRQNPKESSSGDGVNVNFTVAPEVYLTVSSRGSRTHGAYSRAYVGSNQIITGATTTVVNFATMTWGLNGYAGAQNDWNDSQQRQSGFNEQGAYNLKAKVDAVATFAGDSYLSVFLNGVEYVRGPTLTDAKSLSVDADVPLLTSTDYADIRITSATGGTILAGSTRSWVYSRWVHTGTE